MAAATQIGSFIIRGVDTLRLKDYTTGELIDSVKHLKTAGLENTGEVVSVAGGKGNKKIHTYTGSKASKITFTNATNQLNFLAMQTGSNVVTGSREVDVTESHVIKSNKITLTKTIKGDPIGVFVDGVKITKGSMSPSTGQYHVSTQDITFNEDVNGKVAIVTFKSTVENTQAIKQTADSEALTCSLSVDLLLQDVNTKKGYIGQLVAKSAKLNEDFNLNAAQEGEPEGINLPFDLNEVDGYPTWELIVFENWKLGYFRLKDLINKTLGELRSFKLGSRGVFFDTPTTANMSKDVLKTKASQVWDKEILLANIDGKTSEVQTTKSGTYAVSNSDSVVVDSKSLYIPSKITTSDFDGVVFDGRIVKHNPKPKKINYLQSSEFVKYYKHHRITDTINGILYRSARINKHKVNLVDCIVGSERKQDENNKTVSVTTETMGTPKVQKRKRTSLKNKII